MEERQDFMSVHGEDRESRGYNLYHSLTTSASISAPEQVLDFSYKMPLLKNPLEQYYLAVLSVPI